MNAAETEHWRAARTLADLGEVTALFLEGKIGETPTHGGPPDPETAELTAVLAACNRAGFVTTMSQPGVPVDEHGSAQRADVSGFASNRTFAALTAAVADMDLIITACRAPHEEHGWGPFTTITLDYGEEFSWDGGALSRTELEYHYEDTCHPDAVRELCDAWQVTLIDPQWGRNDLLWPPLREFAARHGS